MHPFLGSPPPPHSGQLQGRRRGGKLIIIMLGVPRPGVQVCLQPGRGPGKVTQACPGLSHAEGGKERALQSPPSPPPPPRGPRPGRMEGGIPGPAGRTPRAGPRFSHLAPPPSPRPRPPPFPLHHPGPLPPTARPPRPVFFFGVSWCCWRVCFCSCFSGLGWALGLPSAPCCRYW